MNFKVHPHEKVMREWLDGKAIQYKNNNDEWVDIAPYETSWSNSIEYRVKPKEPEDIIKYIATYCDTRLSYPLLHFVPCNIEDANIKMVFSPEGQLLEVSLS